jgi:predicted phosphodiesterase
VRCLVLSDIHSNLVAFEAVLADAGSVDLVWCLGDVIGYGPQPNECIERLRRLPHVCVAGNHDWAAIDRLDVSDFNPDASRACLWTREQLTASSLSYIQDLPERSVQDHFTLVHGSPRHPIWEYISHSRLAAQNLSHFSTTYCLFGHTHIPAGYLSLAPDDPVEEFGLPLTGAVPLPRSRLLINPGGVGQPRDGDPRASYMLLDLEDRTIQLHRVEYAVEETQRLMTAARLPPRLVTRLSLGW